MSEILSQDQIDQLLSAGGFGSEDLGSPGGGAPSSGNDKYHSLEKNIEIYCKQASAVLGTVLNKKVTLNSEVCGKSDFDTIKTALKAEHLCVALPFKSGLTGEMYLLINNKDVATMGDLMMMGEGNAEYTPEHNDAITELSNQIMSSFSLALTSESGTQISSSPSSIAQCSLANPPKPPELLDMAIVKIAIEGRDETTCVLLIPDELTAQFSAKNPAAPVETSSGSASGGGGFEVSQDLSNQFGQSSSSSMSFTGAQNKSIEVLLDVDLDVSIELGQTSLSIKRILELAPGSIVELDRMAGEPVDLLVNNKPVAKGEVVVIDESFGIRILSLVSPEDRIKSLR
jgi:flagellar motor switch protein FliN/FliY